MKDIDNNLLKQEINEMYDYITKNCILLIPSIREEISSELNDLFKKHQKEIE